MQMKIHSLKFCKNLIKQWCDRGEKLPLAVSVCPQLMKMKHNFQLQQTFRCSNIVCVPYRLTGYLLTGLSGWPKTGMCQTMPTYKIRGMVISREND